MKNFNLNINEVVVVNYEDIIYKCTIQDISESGFSVNVPVNNGELLLLNNGEKLSIQYCSETGSYYEFEAEILDRDLGDKIPLYKLSLPFNLRKIQRRNFVRVPVLKAFEYRKNEEEAWCNAIILDLSGGGMKFKSTQELRLNEKLFIKIETDSGVFETTGEIKRSEKIKVNEHIYALEFDETDENKRDKIIKEVFLVMRKQRGTI